MRRGQQRHLTAVKQVEAEKARQERLALIDATWNRVEQASKGFALSLYPELPRGPDSMSTEERIRDLRDQADRLERQTERRGARIQPRAPLIG